MTTKTKKLNKNVANAQRTRDERATNRTLFVPLMRRFRDYLRKDVANAPQIWLPIECNLIFRYEFAACSLQTRYIFVAILLFCGQRGIDEIPDDKRFLASALNADARTIEKAISELENLELLVERKKEREIRKDTDRQKESVCVEFENLSKNGSENKESLLNGNPSPEKSNENSKHSQFTIEECLKYVETEITKGATINNPKALARNLFNSGEADSFIRAALYPEQQKEVELKQFGEPTAFTDLPCRVCFGAKMEVVKDKGARPCQHCKNERGKATGFEPEEIKGENEQ